jgi:hypothetical protein
MWRTLSILLVLLHPFALAWSQPPDIFRVKLHVNADVRMRDQVERCLGQEFQRLGNVQMTAETHHWLLDILVIDMKPNRGYILSMVILENTTIALNNQAVYIPNLHVLYVDADLPTLCARTVTAFDNSILTPAKAARREQSR